MVSDGWKDCHKTVQKGNDLGERMKNAFAKGFNDGYNQIILIGSDLPDIKKSHIQSAFNALNSYDTVFGPAEDGGYYLIGLSKMQKMVFSNKPWSTSKLLNETLRELEQQSTSFSTLETLNDIDTLEDLESSNFYKSNKELQQKIRQPND